MKKVHLKHYVFEKLNGFPCLMCELHMATSFQSMKRGERTNFTVEELANTTPAKQSRAH